MRILITFIFCFYLISQVNGQEARDLNIGIQIGSASSWLSTNDNTVEPDGDLIGLRFGLIGEKYFRDNYAIMGAFSFLTNQGGTLRHENGGNLLPKSDLSSSSLNSGQKPLPDGTRITYHLNYLEFATGLKLRTNSIGDERSLRIYAELPTVSAGLAVRSKGDIAASGIDQEDETIGKDVTNLYIAWGLGAGIELTLKNGMAFTAGIHYQRSFRDLTRDKGTKALDLIDDKGTTDPSDDEYNTEKENARVLLNGLTIRAGIFF